jgi:hypothetical protein
VIKKSSVIREIMPCSLAKVSRHFWGAYRLLLQTGIVCQARNQYEAHTKFSLLSDSCCFLFGLLLESDDGGNMSFRNVNWLSPHYMVLVCIATKLRDGQLRNWGSTPSGGNYFSLLHKVLATQPLLQWIQRNFSPTVKQPERKADHRSTSRAEVKNCGNIPPIQHT